MKCIVIEDQAPAQRILQKYISDARSLQLERTFCDALEAKNYLRDHPVDLIFLDIDLPRLSGMDFLRSEESHPLIILTTAYGEFALESYQFNVVDYLLKPFPFERFSQAIEKVTAMARSVKKIQVIPEPVNDNYIYVKSSHDLLKIKTEDIILIKSDCDYTEVVTASNQYLTSEALKDWMVKLDDNFKQVHKSYIINMGHLKKISSNKIYLTMDQVIPIGRAFKKHFIRNVLKVAAA